MEPKTIFEEGDIVEHVLMKGSRGTVLVIRNGAFPIKVEWELEYIGIYNVFGFCSREHTEPTIRLIERPRKPIKPREYWVELEPVMKEPRNCESSFEGVSRKAKVGNEIFLVREVLEKNE